jgi:hypothetical protein
MRPRNASASGNDAARCVGVARLAAGRETSCTTVVSLVDANVLVYRWDAR